MGFPRIRRRDRHGEGLVGPTPVAREDIEQMLAVAASAPSGSNTQPWKVYVLTGEIKDRVSKEILKVYQDPAQFEAHKCLFGILREVALHNPCKVARIAL